MSGILKFSVDLDRRKIPKDHPSYPYDTSLDFLVDLNFALHQLNWQYVHYSPDKNLELFGRTDNHSAFVIRFIDGSDDNAIFGNAFLEGKILANSEEIVQSELEKLQHKLKELQPAYHLIQHKYNGTGYGCDFFKPE